MNNDHNCDVVSTRRGGKDNAFEQLTCRKSKPKFQGNTNLQFSNRRDSCLLVIRLWDLLGAWALGISSGSAGLGRDWSAAGCETNSTLFRLSGCRRAGKKEEDVCPDSYKMNTVKRFKELFRVNCWHLIVGITGTSIADRPSILLHASRLPAETNVYRKGFAEFKARSSRNRR